MKILNFGSLNIDYVYKVEHFVQPGETLDAQSRDVFPGGKGLNQSIAMARAGADVYHAGCIGKSDGLFLKELLKANRVHTENIAETDTATGHTIIQVDRQGQNCIILYGGANQSLTREFADSVLSFFSKNDYLVLQNEINEVDYIMSEAHEKGMKIFFNPSPFNEEIKNLPLGKVDCFILNEIEAGAICRTKETSEDALLYSLQKEFPLAEIILTLGRKGVVCLKDGRNYSHGIYDVPVVDTTAAGDTFTGYYIAGLSKGFSIEDSLQSASVASSLSVTKKGAAPSIPYISEVADFKRKLQK
ncbi:MAG: ribokinase [Treponema sp.]|nr:ribokinase [Treponema sp.]